MSGSYCIDTSSLIQARRRLYPPAVFKSLWEKIDGLIDSGHLMAPDDVMHELGKKDDEVHGWAKQRPQLFRAPDEALQKELKVVLADSPALLGVRVAHSGADPWVIALARIHGATVVTQEGRGKLMTPKIPDVCERLKVRCIQFIDIGVELGWKF
jgi:hypothetical protein